MARLPYLSREDLGDDDKGLLDRPIHLHRLLAHSPEGLRQVSGLGSWIRHGCILDPRVRELAIIQVGYLSRSPYEFSHHVKIGHDFGVSEQDVHDLVADTEGRNNGLGPIERSVLRAAREITAGGAISDGSWSELVAVFEPGRIVDLVIVIAFYNQVVKLLGAFEMDVEEDYLPYLERFPLPGSGRPAG